MTGRRLCSDIDAAQRGFDDAIFAMRRRVLSETVRALEEAMPPDRYHRLAAQNLERWQASRCSRSQENELRIVVRPGDWGEVTSSLTVEHGQCFAVLNMANAYVPGGAYVEGAVAQEENMFRRTDCHFSVGAGEYDIETEVYLPEMTELISGQRGIVYLDHKHPRVCIRGPEDRSETRLGYRWLRNDEVFPFFELRAAAQDLRDGRDFDPDEARKRIGAQLDTLRDQRVRHAVLGASGCGAFRNPASRVARLYNEEIAKRKRDFSVLAFAIFSAGYGPGNYVPFQKEFESQ